MSQESLDQKPENTPEGTPETAADKAGKPAPDTMPSTEELLRKAELDAQEHHDAWLRAKAETENVRKRAMLDVANAHKYAVENFAGELVAVKDSLEAALAVESATVESMKSGVELTLKQLSAALVISTRVLVVLLMKFPSGVAGVPAWYRRDARRVDVRQRAL